MNWLILTVISVVALAVSNLLQKVLIKDEKSNVAAYGMAFQLTCALLVALFTFSRGFIIPPIQDLLPNFILEAVLYGSGTLLLFRALQEREASEVAIIASSRALWTIVVGLVLLGESFNISEIIGTALILGGIVLVSLNRTGLHFGKSGLYVLGYAFCYGIAFANDAFILRRSDALSYTVLAFLLPGLFILAVKPSVIKEVQSLLRPATLIRMASLGIFYSISTITVYLAYQQGGDVSQIAPISQSVIILTVLLAAVFLGERERLLKKFASAAMATLGIILLK